MPLVDIRWRQQLRQDVEQRLAFAYPDLRRIASELRDSAAVEVWTESPSDSTIVSAGKRHYSLAGWFAHFRGERQRLAAFNTRYGAAVGSVDPTLKTALDAYLASMPTIGTALSNVLNQYRDAQGRLVQAVVSQAHRDQIAAVIDAEAP